MKKTDLKNGYVVETRNKGRFLIGVNPINKETLYIRTFCEPTSTLEICGDFSSYNDNLLNIRKDIALDIMKVWTDKRALFDDSIEPAWERSFLGELKINSLIWVRDREDYNWQIAIFKGLTEAGRVTAARGLKGNTEQVWVYSKEFKMSDLELNAEDIKNNF